MPRLGAWVRLGDGWLELMQLVPAEAVSCFGGLHVCQAFSIARRLAPPLQPSTLVDFKTPGADLKVGGQACTGLAAAAQMAHDVAGNLLHHLRSASCLTC